LTPNGTLAPPAAAFISGDRCQLSLWFGQFIGGQRFLLEQGLRTLLELVAILPNSALLSILPLPFIVPPAEDCLPKPVRWTKALL
jgi:hypothetical protein